MNVTIAKFDQDVVISAVDIVLFDGTSVTGALDTIMAADQTFASGPTGMGEYTLTEFANATVSAGTWISWHTTTVVGPVTSFTLQITYAIVTP